MYKPKRDLQLEGRWRKLLDLCRRSNQTIRQFCQERWLSESSFFARRADLARRDREPSNGTKSPAFVPVHVVASGSVDVLLPSGIVIRVPSVNDTGMVSYELAA